MDVDEDEHQRDLIAKIAAGDEESFGALYDCFSRSLYSLGMRMLGDAGRAEDMVQDTMVKVWRAADTFDPTAGRVSSWIFTVARRTALDAVRKRSRTPDPVERAEDVTDELGAEQQEWRDWEIGVLLGSLPTDQRVVVELSVIQGYTQKEVAESLDVPLGTIKTRQYAGLKRLRDLLERRALLEATT